MQMIKEGARAVYNVVVHSGTVMANLAVACIAILVTLNVIMRYGIQAPFPWSDEVVTFMVVIMTFMGLGGVFRKGMHIRVTAIFSSLPWQVRNVLWVIICLVALSFVTYLGYATAYTALESLRIHARSPMSELPLFPFQICVPIGLFMLFMPLLVFTIRRIIIAGLGKCEETAESVDQ